MSDDGDLAKAERTARDATADIYTPETPDPLRDGLLRGWFKHMTRWGAQKP